MTPFYRTPSVATPEDWKSVFRFDVQKRPLGSVLEKTCSEVCFCRGIPGVLDSTTWAEDKKYCWKWRQTRKIVIIKNMSLCLGYCIVLDMIEWTNSEHPCKITYSCKIYLFPWHSEVLLCGNCWLPGTFFSLNKLTSRYSQWAGKSKLPDK